MNKLTDTVSTNETPMLSRSLRNEKSYPDKIVQFGTGNFLKGFVDWIVQQLNDKTDLNAGIVAVKLRRGNESQIDEINAQDGLFTLNIRGTEQGELVDSLELINCQNRALSPYVDYTEYLQLAELDDLQWIISNTTEAGIHYNPKDNFTDTPAESFPAKLTQLLYRRYCFFDGTAEKGVRIFCCELIDDNASVLHSILKKYANLWNLDKGFIVWLEESCQFCNTLVDRIVTGKPPSDRASSLQQSLGYLDKELIETESYYQWVIETSPSDEAALGQLFPESLGLNVILTDDLSLYRQRKVRILNGAHTACVSVARLLNIDTVYAATQDSDIKRFMDYLVYQEIMPTIQLPKDQLKEYADSILERFTNPFLHHEWTSIGLNSISKWRARLLPVLLESYSKDNYPPRALVTSLACLLLLYRGEYDQQTFVIQDDEEVLKIISSAWQSSSDVNNVVKDIFSHADLWGENLSDNEDLHRAVALAMLRIQRLGVREYLNQLLAS
jgi:tagaturonate reductase